MCQRRWMDLVSGPWLGEQERVVSRSIRPREKQAVTMWCALDPASLTWSQIVHQYVRMGELDNPLHCRMLGTECCIACACRQRQVTRVNDIPKMAVLRFAYYSPCIALPSHRHHNVMVDQLKFVVDERNGTLERGLCPYSHRR